MIAAKRFISITTEASQGVPWQDLRFREIYDGNGPARLEYHYCKKVLLEPFERIIWSIHGQKNFKIGGFVPAQRSPGDICRAE
jgi:hypothetical protein